MQKILTFLFACLSMFPLSLFGQAGSLDPTFSSDGKLLITTEPTGGSRGDCVAVLPNGKILIGGWTFSSDDDNNDFALSQLTPDGMLDNTFGGGDGVAISDFEFDGDWLLGLAIQPDGKILAAGRSGIDENYLPAVARYLPDGNLDTTFGEQGIHKILLDFPDYYGASVSSIELQPDGKILVSGGVSALGFFTRALIARINPDGSMDDTFGIGGLIIQDLDIRGSYISDLAIQSDGKVLIAGHTQYEPLVSRILVARYLPNGVPDSSFAVNGILRDYFPNSTSSEARALSLQADGKIVIGGTAFGGFWSLIRYLPNGTLDLSFDNDGKVVTQFTQGAGGLSDISIQPDGKIVATGSIYMGNNPKPRFALARFNTNGSLDNTFATGGRQVIPPFGNASSDTPEAMTLQSDGKILVVGLSESNNLGKVAAMRFLNNLSAVTFTDKIDIYCVGGNIGSATAVPFGGTAPFNYNWSNGQTTATATGLAAGIYTVSVTDATGAGPVTASVTITQPAALTLTTAVSGQLTCLQPSATASASAAGGTAPYTFAWPNAQSGAVATFNTPGVYQVTVTDANGCTKTSSVSVVNGDVSTPTAAVAPGGTITCATSQLTLNGNGSSVGAVYSYQWSTTDGNIVSGSSTLTPAIDQCGAYTLTVTKTSNGCTATATTTVLCDTDAPQIPTLQPELLTCINTSATLDGTSTTPGVNYLWTGPNGFTSTNAVVEVSSTGTYGLVVQNPLNGCTSSNSVDVSQDLLSPIAHVFDALPLNCQRTEVQLDGTGTSNGPEFEYAWSTPNGAFVSGTSTLNPIVNAGGDYTLLVMNTGNGCTASDQVTVVQRTAVTAYIANPTMLRCHGDADGSATVAANGGDGAYTYSWSNNTSSASITGLSAGSYEVTVTDGEGCTAATSVTFTEPDPLQLNITATHETAFGTNDGTATVLSSGGTPGYTYQWSNGQTGATIAGLAPGTYQVTVSDANGCSKEETVNIKAFNCAISVDVTGVNIQCSGTNTGSATATPVGGQAPYSFLWSNGQTSQTIQILGIGGYTVTVTDGAGCVTTGALVLTQPAVLIAEITDIQHVVCPGDMGGSATILPEGGVPPYLITGNTTNLGAGNYTVLVTDANGCSATASFTIEVTDNQAPEMICPQNLVACGIGIVHYDAPLVSDNCDQPFGLVQLNGQPSGSFFVEGVSV